MSATHAHLVVSQRGTLNIVGDGAYTPHATAIDVAERLRLALQSHPLEIEGNSLVLTASFGVGTLHPEDTMESLLKKSDLALYQSKRLGRNRVSGESSASPQ